MRWQDLFAHLSKEDTKFYQLEVLVLQALSVSIKVNEYPRKEMKSNMPAIEEVEGG